MTENLPALTLLGRDGCHLCEDMRAALKPWAARFGFAVEEVDISGRPELEARYGRDIPVLMAGETEICRHFFDPAALQTWITGRA
ncbi:MAG: glutaredoxin family protein [Pseudomonadota bacterium]